MLPPTCTAGAPTTLNDPARCFCGAEALAINATADCARLAHHHPPSLCPGNAVYTYASVFESATRAVPQLATPA